MGIFDLSNTQGYQQKWANDVVGAVRAVNADGGIKGRRLDLIMCDSQFNANGSAACGREAVADNVIATIGFAASAAYDSSTIPAHIADFSAFVDAYTLRAPNSFTFWGGALISTSGLASMGKPAGCRKVALVTTTIPPADRAAHEAAFAKAAGASGIQVAAQVFPVAGLPGHVAIRRNGHLGRN